VLCFFRAVPQAAEFFDSQPLSKNKADKKAKKKEGAKANAQTLNSTGFITLPAPQSHANANLDNMSPGPSGFSSLIPSPDMGSPAPTAAMSKFSRISSAVDSSSQGGTPVPSERNKVAFGFGTKRKPEEEAQGSPPLKRR
jgi:U4/U6.U5 tri-snRNP-associated protein 1